MILDIPFRYTALVKTGRRQRSETALVGETATLAIRELASTEAPLVAECRDKESCDVAYRIVEGRFFRSDDERHDEPHDTEWLVRQFSNPEENMDDNDRAISRRFSPPVVAASAVRDVISSRRDDSYAHLVKKVADIALIDGKVWRATTEPVLVCNTRDPAKSHLQILHAPTNQMFTHHYNRPFRLDQAEFAKSWMKEVYGVRPSMDCEVTVHMPDALGFQSDGWQLVFEVERLLSAMQGAVKGPSWEGAPGVEAEYGRLFGAAAMFDRALQAGEADVENIRPQLESAVETCRSFNAEPDDRVDIEERIRACEIALKRWDDNHDRRDEASLAAMF